MKVFISNLLCTRLLRALHNARPPHRFFSLSAGQSVAQLLEDEFGSFHGGLRRAASEQYTQVLREPTVCANKFEMDVPGHCHADPHALPLESELQYGNSQGNGCQGRNGHHSMDADGLEIQHEDAKSHPSRHQAMPGHEDPHKNHKSNFHGVECQNGCDNSYPSGHQSGHKHDDSQFKGIGSEEEHNNALPIRLSDKHHPTIKSSEDIIKLLIVRANEQSWIALDQDMQKFKIDLKPKEVAWVLKVMKNPVRAWGLFKWASLRPGYAHDSACYAAVIDVLGQHSDHFLLNDLLTEMEKRDIPLNTATVNRLIGVYATHEEIDKAEHYFLKLKQLGIEPTPYTFKCMLHAFVKAGRCDKALDIYRVMQKEHQPLTVISYNILLDGLSRNGKVETALNIFEEMKRSGHLADVYTYTIVARAYGQAGMGAKAFELLEDMKQNGVEPNKHTYNNVLDALCGSHERLEDAIKLFKRMAMDGVHPPDAASCQSILKGICKGRQVDRAFELAECIIDKAVKKEVCESFIKVLGKMGYLQHVRVLFQSLKADSIRPSQATSLSMISALCRGGEASEALHILKEAEEQGCHIPLSTHNIILATLRNGNQFEAGYNLFKRMKDRGPSPDVVSYNIVIAGLAKTKKLPLAKSLFKEMVASGCMPNVITFNSLLHSFAREADITSTRKILQTMHTKEVTPDVVTYNCTIECFSRAGKPKVALKVFEEMKEKGCSPSFITYNNVLLALAKAGMPDQVLSIFEQMKEQGFVPDAMTFTILARLYDSNPQLDKKQLKEEIRSAGLAYEITV